MAVEFEKDHKRRTEYLFWPEDLVVKGDLNGRRELPDITDLTASIENEGQGVPVTIRNDGGKAVLVKGFSRWRALVDINKRHPRQKRQIRCVYTQLTEQEAYCENVSENRHRNATTDLDDAHNIKRMVNVYAMSEEQVAKVYFPAANTPEEVREAVKWIKKTLPLASLTKEAETALRGGRVKPNAARTIAKLSEEQQREAVKGSGKVKAQNIRAASGKPQQKSLKQVLRDVINSGKFPGVEGKIVEASQDLMEFLGRLVN